MKTSRLLLIALIAIASSAFAAKVTTEDEAIRLATEAIHKYHLTTLKDDCGLIDVNDRHSRFDIVVRERHTAACDGDPETQPRLFTIRVRKRDGQLTSDVYDGVKYRLANHELGASK
jgi:hypothetical protein